jgi:hypothetical protein
MEMTLLNIGIKTSEMTDAVDTYVFKSKNSGTVKGVFFNKTQEIPDNKQFVQLEQKDKYFFKVFVPYKYIKSIGSDTYATVDAYGSDIHVKFEQILNELNYEGDQVAVVFSKINPISKVYKDTISFIKISLD